MTRGGDAGAAGETTDSDGAGLGDAGFTDAGGGGAGVARAGLQMAWSLAQPPTSAASESMRTASRPRSLVTRSADLSEIEW